MTPEPSAVLHWNWMPHTWVDVVQAAAWVALCLALVSFARETSALLVDREARRRLLLIGGVALAARLLVPWGPINWYSGVDNVDLGARIFSRATTYMAFPNQLVTFTLGFHGIIGFNIAIGTASAMLAWMVAQRAGYGRSVALLLGLAVGVTPLYVRLSASDSSHLLALPLWWLAALAMQRLVRGDGGRIDQVVLFTSAVVACPIRIEAALVMPSVALFIARDRQGLQGVWDARRRWSPFIVGLLLGMACNVAVHHQSWQIRLGQFSVLSLVFEMLARMLFLVDPDLFGFIPLAYILLIWFYLYDRFRRGDRAEVIATVLPFALFSIPYACTGKGVGPDLPGLSYGTTVNMFLLLGAAKGAALLYERSGAGMLRARPRWRRPAIIVASLLVLACLAIPYRTTYAYQEELSFLSRSLPQREAKILALWDPTCPGGDYDCCLALPYPTFVGDFPNLEWQILGQADVDEARLRGLRFDYYYPGSLVAVDVDRLSTWFLARLFPDPELTARQQAPLRTLRSIDEFIRKNYPLAIFRQATVPAHVFGWAPFRDDRMTLTIYRFGHNEPAP